MSDDEAKAIALELQPKLSEWLRERLGHLNFQDAMKVTMILFLTGAETARYIGSSIKVLDEAAIIDFCEKIGIPKRVKS